MNNTKTKKRIDIASIIVFGIIGFIMAIIVVTYIYSIFWALMSSLKDTFDYTLNPLGLPDQIHFENYVNAWKDLKIEIYRTKTSSFMEFTYWNMFGNSLVMTVIHSFMAVFMPLLTSYAVARYRFFGRNALYRIAIVVMIIPIYGALSSSLAVRRALGIYDNMILFLLTQTGGFGFNFVLLYGVFRGLDNGYAEAAEIDGAGHHCIMWRIYVPMVFSTLIALFVLAFVGHWNDYMTVVTYLPSTPNLAYGIYMFNTLATVKQHSVPEVLTGFVYVAIPAIILWVASQKLIVGKVAVGGLKG